jgi:hypothetical protein
VGSLIIPTAFHTWSSGELTEPSGSEIS